ncbi:MAG: PilZ domain-containing protein [Bdellovibrio sp.]|nr:PilZ domain-containing protein [Bdellovibrio sp.]
MSQQQGQNIFKKVPVSEKKFLFREIAHDKLQISCKGDDDNFFNLIAIQTEKDEDLMCHHTANSKEHEKNQSVMVNFQFKTERYFFRTDLSFNSGWAVLKIDGDLFQLQRRENVRVDLPAKYDSAFSLHVHNGQKYFLDAKIRDVSAGGVKIEMVSDIPVLKLGDKVRGTMRLGIRRVMEFEMEVRFAQRREVNGQGVQTAGLQFLNVDKMLENRLLSLMMDLQREIFLKYPDKK